MSALKIANLLKDGVAEDTSFDDKGYRSQDGMEIRGSMIGNPPSLMC